MKKNILWIDNDKNKKFVTGDPTDGWCDDCGDTAIVMVYDPHSSRKAAFARCASCGGIRVELAEIA